MSIYSRTGDKGTTSLYRGKRVSKSDPRVEVYGSFDELTSFIGLVAVKIKNKKDKEFLTEIQRDLYKIMSYLSGVKLSLDFLNNRVLKFENKIDQLDKKLAQLNKFILPGGTEISSWFHVLRTVCRRAERNMVKYSFSLKIIRYLNRLSDLLFVLARTYGKNKEIVL
ncbi:ATP:cob(I)alamin adenosyltransferase [Candidatus Roizmanbacteria bacterium CG_4_10_14_0_2_um_filter_36_35]|uniref:Corrinoid adenosyltransferase n=3 Tax=Candidatus Roizmaniibacteriota TaxID=1752723 RepID=A0A2M7UCD8_9BACT|nr:MAG: ATP:cob(I)alamin adenosyltransferase [Candidatus Roizmanbacteria bacterium CG11_big_fil_rev_8_21_14_0_20_35_14]PIZ68868.1 MAG: ATP:cob(I)alamin adenosyltransferase [Candidatus Roizmanbacteria bacterium CG_4_10_14_0_2_um_filter_36_35]PJC31095.1 MAG: ATP:cob(I)alamin adenosyltransferase [Candidatus Roizmanbacteria bacterium CG_4_9_14_0_2_um_filter_36_12]PJC79807.1 MAG: ATP:cob(I)alamin adenosyltransferase [Candidatus Roizmanbacteria bacterium CG_4_8_14_3_um_filter_36_12]